MRIQPLCDSPDLGAAIGFAQKKYAAVSKGLRPSTRTFAYKDLLCRFVLTADPSDDYVQILPGRRLPQEILFLKNDWDVETLPTGDPFYGSNSDPDHFFKLALGGTATIVVLGGPSKKPVVLASSNPAVCSVASVATTYAEVAALATSTLDPPFDAEDTCTPALFTLTVLAYGRTTITMTQDGTAKYLAVSLFGGNFTFGPMPVEGHHFGEAGGVAAPSAAVRSVSAPTKTFVSARGQGASRCRSEQRVGALVTAVAAPASRAFKAGSYVGKAGAVASAECRTARGGAYRGKAGAVGQAASAGRSSSLAKPVAVAMAVAIPYDQCHDTSTATGLAYLITTNGLAKRGGTLRVEVVSMGPNCAVIVPDSGLYAPTAVLFTPAGTAWSGTTYFVFRIAETANGVTLYSDPATCNVQVYPPAALFLTLSRTDKYNAVTITGGAPPYGLRISGNYTGLSFGALANTAAIIRAPGANKVWSLYGSNGYCTTDGFLRVTDVQGRVVEAAMLNFGIPSCSVAPPPATGWVRKWVSPHTDIRNHPAWAYYATYDKNCQTITSSAVIATMPLLELISPDGKYKVKGNYFLRAMAYYTPPATYGYPNQQGLNEINAALGLNFGYTSFSFCSYSGEFNDTSGNFPEGFYFRELWHWE